MRVDWRSDYGRGVGDSFGYATHDRKAREACVARGWKIDPTAPVAVTVSPPHSFTPAEGKFNALFTAWENPTLSDLQIERSAQADVICVPSTFLVEAFKRTGKPVFYVPEGVDPVFATVNRSGGMIRTKKNPFRFLWVGAPNNRKGAEPVLQAFRLFTEGPHRDEFRGKVELYLKTSVHEPVGRRKEGPITLDDRRLPIEDLVGLYQSAHCFVFPTLGEGFGLTAAEAARTGLPVIYPPHTSMIDLFDPATGYELDLNQQRSRWKWPDCDGRGTPMVMDVTVQVPTTKSVAFQMLQIYRNPDAAFERGLRAAEKMKLFTWARCADALTLAIEATYHPPA